MGAKFGPDIIKVPQASSDPTGSAGDLYYNTTDNEFKVFRSSWSKINAGTQYAYARYLTGAATNNHHPRVARIYVIDENLTKYTVQTFASDNCSDTGGIPSQGAAYTYNSSSAPKVFIGLGGYVSYAGARGAYVTLQGSQDNSTWTDIGTVDFSASTCGEKDFII